MDLKEHISKKLYQAIKSKYKRELYSDAIIAAIKSLTILIREKGQIDGDGTRLVGNAFGGKSPKIRLNKMQTKSDIDEQNGFEQMLRGIYIGIRNPRTHEEFKDTIENTNLIILMVDYFYKNILNAKSYYKLEEFKKRIFDPLFVEKDEYAEMLIKEIPNDEIVPTAIDILKNRNDGDSKKLEYFFNAIFNNVSSDQKVSIMRAFSNELKDVKKDFEIVNVVRYIKGELWSLIDDDVKLRIETSMIKSVEKGTEDMYTGILDGALGTWSTNFAVYFKLRDDLGKAIIGQLKKNWNAQNYIGNYFIYNMTIIITEDIMIQECCSSLASATMENNAKALKIKLENSFLSYPTKWRELILKYGLKYKDSDSEYYEKLSKIHKSNDEDLPF